MFMTHANLQQVTSLYHCNALVYENKESKKKEKIVNQIKKHSKISVHDLFLE